MQLIPWYPTDPSLVAPPFTVSALQRIIAHTNFDTENHEFHDLFVWPLSESINQSIMWIKQRNYRTSILAIKVAVGRVTRTCPLLLYNCNNVDENVLERDLV